MYINKSVPRIRFHLTNVAGVGASQLVQSLLPALERNPKVTVERIYLPNRGALATYESHEGAPTDTYHRRLPNAISRFIECIWLAQRFDGSSPLLVLGDLPLRCQSPQTVFVQTPNVLKPTRMSFGVEGIKYWISRTLFRAGINNVNAFIVQTDVMRDELERSYPSLSGRVHVIAQPVPSWLLRSGLKRYARSYAANDKLELIYPAACYPHKNHNLLSRLDSSANWPVNRLTLTLDIASNPAPRLTWVNCAGFLSPGEIIEAYSKVDAVLFLSKKESYGFPLVEAMFVGLPIVCPDLPYARTLCGDQAIYFNPDNPDSLRNALHKLRTLLKQNWWPDWESQLSNIPETWEDVADKMLSIACKGAVGSNCSQ